MTDEFGARERWLHDAAQMVLGKYEAAFTAQFGDEGFDHLKVIRASTGFPSRRGENGKVIGQCWKAKAAADGSHHIFINPLLEDPVRVVATLAHEMVHAADDGENGHKGKFTKAVRAMGLEGKPTATFAGEEFEAWVKNDVLSMLGKYPHVALTPTLEVKPQKTYMRKIVCPYDTNIVRMTRSNIDKFGLPFCGSRSHVIDGERTDRRVRMEEV